MQRLSMTAGAALLLGALFAPRAGASEFHATLGGWGYHFSGNVDDRGRRYDFQDDLELEPRRRRSAALEFDTRPGWWPDFAAGYTQIGADGDHVESTGGPIPGTRTITTSARFDAWDLVARYPFRLGPLCASAGVALQQLRGDLVIVDSDDSITRREHYDEVFPQLHAQLRWRLGPLALVAAGQGIAYDGSRALEWRGVAEFRAMEPLLVEFGWQEKRYDISLTDYALDARVRGALVRIGFLYR
jgi:hypothetical protein